MQTGQRVAAAGMIVSGMLAVIKIAVGLAGHSTAVVADGLESGGDVFASGLVLLALILAAKPADENHPYGHGRVEILTGLLIGLVLTAGGTLICYLSLSTWASRASRWPLTWCGRWSFRWPSKTGLAGFKFHYGRKLKSAALTADAWNDSMDTLSATAALIAVGLTLSDPVRYLDADRYGGMVVGLIVISAGVRVAWDTSLQLMDTMPDDELMKQIRAAAAGVPGVRGVEKCYARKTGLRYHVDLHLEVDPNLTVRQSHQIAHEVRQRVMGTLDWVADVLVHVEPAP